MSRAYDLTADHWLPLDLTERQQTILRILATDGVTVFEFRNDMTALVAMGLAEIGRYQPDYYFLTPAGREALEETANV